MRNHSSENKFDLHENERAGETHFHMNGFAQSKTRFDTEAKGNSEMACSLSQSPSFLVPRPRPLREAIRTHAEARALFELSTQRN